MDKNNTNSMNTKVKASESLQSEIDGELLTEDPADCDNSKLETYVIAEDVSPAESEQDGSADVRYHQQDSK